MEGPAPEAARDWGGHVLVTKDNITWTDLDGAAGSASALLSPEDHGIIQLRNPGAYTQALLIADCAGYAGADLQLSMSFEETNDVQPPSIGTAIVRPEAGRA
jgi:hypothetical protein